MQFQNCTRDQFPFGAHFNGGYCKSVFPHPAKTYIVPSPCRQPRRARPSMESTRSYPSGTTWFMPANILRFGLSDDEGDGFYFHGQPPMRAHTSPCHHKHAIDAQCAEPSRTCRRGPVFPFMQGHRGEAGDAVHRRHCQGPCLSRCGRSKSSPSSSSRQSHINDTLHHITKGLFGYLCGDEGIVPGADSKCPPPEQVNKEGSSDNNCPCPAEGKCEETASTDETGKPSEDVTRSSETDGNQQKPDEETQTAVKSNDGEQEASSRRPLWTRSVSLPGFNPSEIDVKVKNDKVHVRGRHEMLRGPSSCLSRMEVRHVVSLPNNVDQTTLACSLKPDGTLLLSASLTAKLGLGDKTDKLQALEHKDETEVRPNEDRPSIDDQKLDEEEQEKEERTEAERDVEEVTRPQNVDGDLFTTTTNQELDQEEQKTTRKEKFEEIPEHNKEDTIRITTTKQEANNDRQEDEEEYGEEFDEVPVQSHGETGMDNCDKCSTEAQFTNEDGFQIITDADCSPTDTLNPETNSDETINAEKNQEGALTVPSGDKTSQKIPDDSTTNSKPLDADATPPIRRSDDEVHAIEESAELSNDRSPSSGNIKAAPYDFSKDSNHSQSDNQGAFRMSIPLAGFSPENNIHIRLHGNTVTITAHRLAWVQDSPYTEGIERQVQLPAHLDVSTVRCLYEDSGNLVITARPRDH